jgi:ribosomal protein S24E
MELKITSKKQDKYFDRTIVDFQIKLESKETIKLEDVKKALSEHFKEGYIIVYTMKNVYGSREIKGKAHIYASEEKAKRLLQKYILKKNGVVYAEKPKEEKAAK